MLKECIKDFKNSSFKHMGLQFKWYEIILSKTENNTIKMCIISKSDINHANKINYINNNEFDINEVQAVIKTIVTTGRLQNYNMF